MTEQITIDEYRKMIKKGLYIIKSEKKPSKYRNKIIHASGKKFDSKKEYHRFLELSDMLFKGSISNLQEQVRYNILINDIRICAYVADFVYVKCGEVVVEDVKSEMTRRLPLYRLKYKLMKAVHGITINEV
jgi:hypothetical protein